MARTVGFVWFIFENSLLLLLDIFCEHTHTPKKNLRKHRVERMRNTFLSQL